MYSERTTIVDVKQTGESEYTLGMTAGDLYVRATSGDVIRRHDVSASAAAPENKYVDLSGVKYAEADGTYTFTFASGDVFTASSPDDYPISNSLSDDIGTGGGSGGGGVLVVHANEVTGALDKTWQEIYDADFAVLKPPTGGDSVRFAILTLAEELEGEYVAVFIYVAQANNVYVSVTDSPDGYPVLQGSGGGGGEDQGQA